MYNTTCMAAKMILSSKVDEKLHDVCFLCVTSKVLSSSHHNNRINYVKTFVECLCLNSEMTIIKVLKANLFFAGDKWAIVGVCDQSEEGLGKPANSGETKNKQTNSCETKNRMNITIHKIQLQFTLRLKFSGRLLWSWYLKWRFENLHIYIPLK